MRDDDQPAERDALLGTLLAGRYRIEALIGSGGMGAVYRAEHVHMRKAVAVKVLHKEMTAFPEVVARFEREAVRPVASSTRTWCRRATLASSKTAPSTWCSSS